MKRMTHSAAPFVPTPTPPYSTTPPPLARPRFALRERYELERVPDDALHTRVKALVGRHNVLTADLLAHLAEVDARGIYRERACSSLYAYCVYELRFSEDEAQRRSQAARTARRFPILFEMLAEGAIHMTGLLLLAPHLTAENRSELLARARFRTKREIERLVAEVAPRADIPARIEPLGPSSKTITNLWQAYTASLRGRVRELEPGIARGQAPAPVFEESGQVADSELDETGRRGAPAESPAPARNETPLRAIDSEPVVPLRYRIEFTVNQEYVDRLEEARDLLQHQVPNRDVARIHELALAMFVERLRKRRGASSGPQRRVEAERAASGENGAAALEHVRGRNEPTCDESAPERIGEPSVDDGSAPERIDERFEHNESPPGSISERPQSAPERISAPRPSELSALERISAPRPSELSAPERISSPRPAELSAPERTMTPSRHIPVAIRRHVWTRDGGRCTFSDGSGRRCRERSGLEVHHERAFARGGSATVENLRLLCRAHNALFAERDFGRAHIESMRNGGRPK